MNVPESRRAVIEKVGPTTRLTPRPRTAGGCTRLVRKNDVSHTEGWCPLTLTQRLRVTWLLQTAAAVHERALGAAVTRGDKAAAQRGLLVDVVNEELELAAATETVLESLGA